MRHFHFQFFLETILKFTESIILYTFIITTYYSSRIFSPVQICFAKYSCELVLLIVGLQKVKIGSIIGEMHLKIYNAQIQR